VKDHRADRDPDINIARAALKTRALPLLLGVIALLAIFLPDTLSIIVNSVRAFAESPGRSIKQYNTVEAAFVTVWLFELFLAVVNISLVAKVSAKLASLKESDPVP
jgi:hypothetical protein